MDLDRLERLARAALAPEEPIMPDAVAEFMAACDPATVLALVAAARRGGAADGPGDEVFGRPGIGFPERDRPTLTDLLAKVLTPEQRQAAERNRLRLLVANAGGDPDDVRVVSSHPIPWAGMGDDARIDVVEDASGGRHLVRHDWGEAEVVGPDTLDRMRDYLLRQVAAVEEIRRQYEESDIADRGGGDEG